MKPFENRQVEAVYDSQPEPIRSRLLQLRELVYEVADAPRPNGPQTAPLVESLKWNEASYAPVKPKIGSPLRIARHAEQQIALYFNCNTLLVEQFRGRFGDALTYSKNRAIVLNVKEELPESILRECLNMALTYHWQKRQRQLVTE